MSRRLVSAVLAAAMAVTLVPVAPNVATATPPSSAAGPAYAHLRAGRALAPRAGLDREKQASGVVVRWAKGVQATQISAAASRLGFKVSDAPLLGHVLVEPVEKGLTATRLVARLREAHLVTRAEPAKQYRTAGTAERLPNDPVFPDQWALRNTGQQGGVAGADIAAPSVWTSTTGSKSIVVAVVDTGVDIAHPDLAANIWTNTREIPNNGADDDRNGYEDDVHGYDFWNDDGSVYDAEEGDLHGTHVAGIIGAVGDNGLGVAGVNWNVTLMPVKGLSGYGDGWDWDLARAIVYAVDNGADVINCSWGGDYSEVLETAIEHAASRGVVIAAAAGNAGYSNDDWGFYPASSEATNVISVAATDRKDRLAPWSNFGARSVDLAAPGADVTSTLAPELLGVFADRPGYKALFLAFAPEVLSPAGVLDDVMARSMTRLQATASTPILVVDDSAAKLTKETPGVRLSEYTSALAQAGYTDVTTWSTDAKGSPAAADLYGHTVVWFTGKAAWGWYDEWTLDAADQAAMSEFLDGGGRLLLASGEAAYEDWIQWMLGDDPFEEAPPWEEEEYPFVRQYFGVEAYDYTSWSSSIQGVGCGFEGVSGAIPASYLDWEDMDSTDWPTAADSLIQCESWAKPAFGGTAYATMSGTSMAAPQVAGAAALLMAGLPTATPQEIVDRISNTVRTTPELAARTAFGGRLDIAAALGEYPGRPAVVTPAKGAHLNPGDTRVAWRPASGGRADATFEVEAGLPARILDLGFEDGSMAPFSSETTVPWTVSDDPRDAHSGTRGLRSGVLPIGVGSMDPWVEIEPGLSAVDTTITVPEGGAQLSFWWSVEADYWATWAYFLVDGQEVGLLDDYGAWVQLKTRLSAGEHRLEWVFEKYPAVPVGRDGLAIDDVRLDVVEFEPVTTAPAGAREATWSVPATDVAGAALRVRATADGHHSPWAYAEDLSVSTDVTAPSAPVLSGSQDGNGRVSVAWTKPDDADLASVRVLRSANGVPVATDDQAFVSYEGTSAGSVADGPFRHGTRLTYAAYAADTAGNWSVPSVVETTVVDVTAPGAVTQLGAELIDGVVALGWRCPAPKTYAGVKVLRRTDRVPTGPSDKSATVVFEGMGSEAWDFALTARPVDVTARYAVYAYDVSGNVSAVATTSIAVDTIGPSGWMCLNDDDDYSTSPTVTVDSTVMRAYEMRFDTGSGFGAWRPYAEQATVGLLPIEGPQYVVAQYRDRDGLVLEAEDDIYVNISAPSTPTSLTATVWGDDVKLRWNENPEDDIEGYHVYVQDPAVGRFVAVTPVPVPYPSFVVAGLSSDRTYRFKVMAVDGVGHKSLMSAETTGAPGEGLVRVAGRDKYDTVIKTNQRHFTEADRIILVSGESLADAPPASALAGCYRAPLYMTPPTGLPAGLVAEIQRLGATNVTVIGGTGPVPDAVLRQLPAGVTVQRIAGADRYQTSMKVAEEVLRLTGADFSGRIYVVNGTAMADAVAVAPIAYAQRIPVVLVDSARPTRVALPAALKSRVDLAWALGGYRIVTKSAMATLGVRWDRIAGADRYETAAMIAEQALDEDLADVAYTGLASGYDYRDALVGGVAIGERGGVMLLTAPSSLSEATMEFIFMNGGRMERTDVFGRTTDLTASAYSQTKAVLDLAARWSFDEPEYPEEWDEGEYPTRR